jgi:hypothetical protein
MPVLIQHKVRDKKMGQVGLIEVVADLQPGIAFAAYQPLHLKRQIAEASCKKGILAIALYRGTGQRLPLRTDEMRLSVGRQNPLIEAREKNGRACSLSQTAHVAPVEFNQAPWTGESRLTRRDLIATQSDASSPARQRYGPGGYVSATVRYFESNSVGCGFRSFHHLDLFW